MIVSILRADRGISGLALRFVALWSYLSLERPQEDVWLFSNESLLDQVWGKNCGRGAKVISFEDRGPAYPLRLAWSALKFLWTVIRHRIRTVHLVAGGQEYLAVEPVLRWLGVKVCFTFATAGLEVGIQGIYLERLKRALRRAPNVEFLNPEAQVPDYGHKRFYSPCSFPYVLGLGKDIFPGPPDQRKNIIVFSGLLALPKNPQLALEAFAGLLESQGQRWPDLELHIFGHGVLETEMRTRAASVNMKCGREAVRFVDSGLLFRTLAVSRIFLSLQEPDNYPSQSLMEAMLYENAVVATDVGLTRRIVPEPGNALVPVSAAATQEAMERLLAGPLCNPDNAIYIRQHHSPGRFADYFLEVHRNLR